MRDLFDTARKQAPAVIFIDELDAVGRRRGSGVGPGNDEREQTLNQLLVCLDGFEANPRVVVVAATNRSDVLDSALMRPGRFDLRIEIPTPDAPTREEILRLHTRGKRLADGVDLAALAAQTAGFTGAQLAHVCNAAVMRAVRRTRGSTEVPSVSKDDVDAGLRSIARTERRFDALDALLVESTGHFALADLPVEARAELADGGEVVGRVIWGDAHFLKFETEAGPRIVAKGQIRGLVALPGTARVAELRVDPWAGTVPSA